MRLAKRGRELENRSKIGLQYRAGSSLLEHTFVQAALLLATVGVLGLILVLEPSSVPDQSLDLRVGEPAPHEIRAARDFSMVMVDTTELESRRADAESQILPVWDFEAGRTETVLGHIEETFSLMRRHLKQAVEERRAELERERIEAIPDPADAQGSREDASELNPIAQSTATPQEGGTGEGSAAVQAAGDTEASTTVAAEDKEGSGSEEAAPIVEQFGVALNVLNSAAETIHADELSILMADVMTVLSAEDRIDVALDHRAEIIRGLQAGLNPSTISVLGEDGFSPASELALKQLVSEILNHPLVHSREVLLAQAGTGITLRTQREGRTINEAVRRSFTEFIDQNEVESHLAELASMNLPSTIEEATLGAILTTASELIRGNVNTRFNPGETDARRLNARAQVQPQTDITHYRKGDVIIYANAIVTVPDREVIEIMKSLGERDPVAHPTEVLIGNLLYILLVLMGVTAYSLRYVRHFTPTIKDLGCLTVVLLFMVTITKLISLLAGVIGSAVPDFPVVAIYAAIPFATGAMLIRLVLNAESALIFSIAFALLVLLILPEQPIFGAYSFIGSLASIGAAERAPTRIAFFKAGFLVSLVNLAFGVVLVVLSPTTWSWSSLWILGLCLSSGLGASILVTALLPLLESTFHYITDIKLLELSNPNHPALHELLVRAPGSYHHSMIVGNLVEAACTAIGANPLLGRVGAYYHDIGKSKNPQYFAENQSRVNPHDKLKPNMSALIIKSHVKDGLEIAQNHRLPKQIIRFIEEHQGTGLIAYFYQKAKEQEDPEHDEVHEKDFRYPGPTPQTPETAICMLADRIEAAARALTDPTPPRLKGLVQKIINGAFTDEQFDECDLTLRDLDNIAREIIRVLLSVYHQRPEYPKERPTTTGKSSAVPAKESTNGGGDKDPNDSGDAVAVAQPDPTASTTTLKRLGIDQVRAVDPAHRRPRD